MIFSHSVKSGKCTECGNEVKDKSSSSLLYFLILSSFAIVSVGLNLRPVLEPAWWQWPAVILLEITALIGSVMICYAASRRFQDNTDKCSGCGGQIEITVSGFHHSVVPSIEDIAIGILYAGINMGIVSAILWLGKGS